MERGYLDADLAFGDAAALQRTLDDVARRRGPLGELLAKGSRAAAT